ncbi:VanZ family protein [Nocardia crassostreae]|uniref:VanZ family protein n=1 Tax=Nocardia crassostreae TaxID=53428 RepID=UPI0012F84DC8|nr:VanZ family protein [Nocardia crassostreae]
MTVGAAALVRIRVRRGRRRGEALRWTVTEAGILARTLPWVWMILTPAHGERKVILIPFRDFLATLMEASTNTVVQIGANLILFVPLGFFLPLRFPRFAGVARMFAVGFALSAALEIAQYALDLGRYSSIDDVLMNATGAALGAYLCARSLPYLAKPPLTWRFA